MRCGGALLALGGVLVAAYPLAAPRDAGVSISPDLLDDIYTFAAYTRASYCAANHDGVAGNAVCSGGACALFGGATTAVEFTTDSADVVGNVAVSHARRLVVVSFRGSDGWADVARNLRLLRADVPELCAGCTVHHGYWAAFFGVRDRIEAAVLPYATAAVYDVDAAADADADVAPDPVAPYRVVITGHSMGGALAVVTAAWLRSRGRRCDLFTYGAPRVGNAVLAGLVSGGHGGGGGGVTAHVVNGQDPIASHPALALGYASVVPEFWFEAGIGRPAWPDNLRVCDGVARASDECSASAGGWLPVLRGGLADHAARAYSNQSTACGGG